MAGGFQNVVLPLGLGATQPLGAAGGFATPVPGLRLAGGAAAPTGQGGFGTPLGVFLVRSISAIEKGGFTSPLPLMGFLGGGQDTQQSDYKTRRMFFRGLSNR